MTTVKTLSVDIRRSEMTTIRVTVPAWELPVLQALHGRGNLAPAGEGTKDYEELPNVEAEFERLTLRYGRERRDDGSLGMPLMEAVYGQFQPGIMNLQRSMEAATVSAGG